MKATLSQLLVPLLTLLLAAGVTWWWYANMEKRWEAQVETSEQAVKNPMLAATRLLTRHRHAVTSEETLSRALTKPLPSGTLILAGNSGVMTMPQVRRLLDWVARGNTLIASPMWGGEEDQQADKPADGAPAAPAAPKRFSPFRRNATQGDPLGNYFGVKLVAALRPDQICRRTGLTDERAAPKEAQKMSYIDCVASITLPDGTYPLRLDVSGAKLGSRPDTSEMLFSDDDAEAVRAFEHGKGRVVFIAQNYFQNANLQLYDHAELLLGLAGLNRQAPAVLIVQRPDVPTWYAAMWALFPLCVVALATALLLWAWAAVRSFGPRLPEPDLARRSLLEHVNASSRWLWKTGKGRLILLAAAREATEKILLRRLPDLQKLAPQQKIELLAQQSKLTQADLDAALLSMALPRPAEFTRQIRTLQRLRKQYDRA